MSESQVRNGLVLTGGGARAAYQVGALRAIAEITKFERNPFHIITGFSAGAINGTWLASRTENFDQATKIMWDEWAKLQMDHVFKINALSYLQTGVRWIKDRALGGTNTEHVNHLLDTSPLFEFLKRHIDFKALNDNLQSQRIHGLALTAVNYNTGYSTVFFDGDEGIPVWKSMDRLAVRTKFDAAHVMASSAIPIFFPPIKIGDSYFGDGMVRLNSPMSPVIHMGADRVLVIGVRGGAAVDPKPVEPNATMSVGEIAGTILNGLFFDVMDVDLGRMRQINRSAAVMSKEELLNEPDKIRNLPLLTLNPSSEALVSRCDLSKLPATFRFMLKGLGVTQEKGQDLLSYLSFEPTYTQSLLELGYKETLAKKSEIRNFFGL